MTAKKKKFDPRQKLRLKLDFDTSKWGWGNMDEALMDAIKIKRSFNSITIELDFGNGRAEGLLNEITAFILEDLADFGLYWELHKEGLRLYNGDYVTHTIVPWEHISIPVPAIAKIGIEIASPVWELEDPTPEQEQWLARIRHAAKLLQEPCPKGMTDD